MTSRVRTETPEPERPPPSRSGAHGLSLQGAPPSGDSLPTFSPGPRGRSSGFQHRHRRLPPGHQTRVFSGSLYAGSSAISILGLTRSWGWCFHFYQVTGHLRPHHPGESTASAFSLPFKVPTSLN